MDESALKTTTNSSELQSNSSSHPDKNKKLIVLLFSFSILIIVLGIVLAYTSSNERNLSTIPGTTTKPNVLVKTEYENPFDKSAQYVNPFSSYKNPFDTLK